VSRLGSKGKSSYLEEFGCYAFHKALCQCARGSDVVKVLVTQAESEPSLHEGTLCHKLHQPYEKGFLVHQILSVERSDKLNADSIRSISSEAVESISASSLPIDEAGHPSFPTLWFSEDTFESMLHGDANAGGYREHNLVKPGLEVPCDDVGPFNAVLRWDIRWPVP